MSEAGAAMRVAIMGAGGVGSYVGGRLAAAGIDTALIGRGPHLEAMRKGGLRITSPKGDAEVASIRATDDPAEIGPVDAVILTVKLYDVEAACQRIRPLIGPETVVIPIQNGVAMADWLPALVGPAHAAGGLVFISAFVTAPGHVSHISAVDRLVIGALDGARDPRLERFRDAAVEAGLDVVISDDIRRALWEKFLFLAAIGAVGCLARQSIGTVRENPDLRALYVEAMAEIRAVAEAKGITLADDIVAKTLAFTENFAPEAKASMLEDLEAGKRLEVAWLSGAVARMGAEAGVPTPVHRIAYAALKPFADGR